jgi:hypothetical protein
MTIILLVFIRDDDEEREMIILTPGYSPFNHPK